MSSTLNEHNLNINSICNAIQFKNTYNLILLINPSWSGHIAIFLPANAWRLRLQLIDIRNTSSSHSIIKLHSYIFRQTNQSYNFLMLCLSLPRKCSRLFYILTCQPLSWTPWSNLLQLFNIPLPHLNPPNEPYTNFTLYLFQSRRWKVFPPTYFGG